MRRLVALIGGVIVAGVAFLMLGLLFDTVFPMAMMDPARARLIFVGIGILALLAGRSSYRATLNQAGSSTPRTISELK